MQRSPQLFLGDQPKFRITVPAGAVCNDVFGRDVPIETELSVIAVKTSAIPQKPGWKFYDENNSTRFFYGTPSSIDPVSA